MLFLTPGGPIRAAAFITTCGIDLLAQLDQDVPGIDPARRKMITIPIIETPSRGSILANGVTMDPCSVMRDRNSRR